MLAIAEGEGGGHLSKGPLPSPPHKQEVRVFIDRVGGGGKTAQSSLTVISKLIISGLTSVILVVLGRVHLQFQDPFAPIS